MPTTLLARRPFSPRASHTPLPLNRRLLENLDQVDSLPHLPESAIEAMTLSNSQDATLAEMAAVIRRDAVMATAVLKMANSPVYRGSGEVADLQMAVNRLGFRGCANLIAGIGMRSVYATHPKAVQETCEQVFQHSLLAANLASAVNRSLFLGLQGEEFSASLLHDMGRVVLCVKAAEFFTAAGLSVHDDQPDILERERGVFLTDHCALGAAFAERNDLPPRIRTAIYYHHRPVEAPEFKELTAVVALADGLAHHIQTKYNVTAFQMGECPGGAAMRGLVDAKRFDSFEQRLPRFVVHAVKETRGMLRSMGG